ncbi:MAG TPA: mannitol dehydrogenase family protein [Propionibacteriaceae bacterium]|jgi:mannitol 2-dehydrogenase
MNRLSSTSLHHLPPAVRVPGYDPHEVRTGIVHFGVGAFHRAHQAMYFERLLEAGHLEWGVCGVGVLPTDRHIRDIFAAQDHLYTLVTVAPGGETEARVIGSVREFLYAPDDPAAVQVKLADPATRIVSLTITEGGYSINDATGEFEPRDQGTLADLSGPALPHSVLGHVTTALRTRRDAGTVPFTVMSCNNIQANGRIARRAVLAFAERVDPALAAWISEHVAFPNSMVDRITPATTDETR